jgi:hypothetical protein
MSVALGRPVRFYTKHGIMRQVAIYLSVHDIPHTRHRSDRADFSAYVVVPPDVGEKLERRFRTAVTHTAPHNAT